MWESETHVNKRSRFLHINVISMLCFYLFETLLQFLWTFSSISSFIFLASLPCNDDHSSVPAAVFVALWLHDDLNHYQNWF